MADEQREPATMPADDPDATTEPETGAAGPAVRAGEAVDTADPEASAPLLATEAPESVGDTTVSGAEVVEPETDAAAPAVELSNPDDDTPENVAEGSVAEASAPTIAAEPGEPATSVQAPAAESDKVETDALVSAGATAAPAAEAGDAVVEAPAGPVGAAVEPAEEEQPTRGRRAMTFFREFVETILLTLVIFVAVRTLVVNFRVDGESMRPTLMNGEYLLVNRATYFHFDLNALRNLLPGPDRQDRDVVYLFGPPARGDIIVFEPPFTSDKPFVKRVIGLPGDTIAIREDHRVYVNGQPLDEHYIAAPPRNLYPSDGGTYTVPPGMIFVMGDNRNNSQDSRSFSAVSMDSVIGKAVVTYWPLDVFGFVPHERYALAGDQP